MALSTNLQNEKRAYLFKTGDILINLIETGVTSIYLRHFFLKKEI